jgi:hypothetical protein
LRRELERRQGRLADLIRQRDELTEELNALEGVFGASEGTVGTRRGPGRPRGTGRKAHRAVGRTGRRSYGRNKTNLVTALKNTLSGKTMSVVDVTQQVQKNGYKTTSPNFRTIVNQALIANPTVFKKVARGEYTAR